MRVLLALLFLSGCSSGERLYTKAQDAQEKKLYAKAAALYQKFAEKNPKHHRAPEALFRAAEIFRVEFQVSSDARELYRKILTDYKNEPGWTVRAQNALFRTPDYFPLHPGCVWTEGDSSTGGRNMRAEVRVSSSTVEGACLEKKIFAGENLVSRIESCYEIEGETLIETKTQSPLLKSPFQEGQSWSASGSRGVHYRIESENAVAQVRAGDFQGCLKVKEQIPGFSSWTFTYYAPGVGKVLTTVGTTKGEHRNAELLSYTVPKEGL